MHKRQAQPLVRRVGFILLPGFALTSFSLAVEALSVSNLLLGYTAYDYQVYSGDIYPNSNEVLTSNHIPIRVSGGFETLDECNLLFICAYKKAANYDNPKFLAKLRTLKKTGCRLASLSSGSFILAKAGLLRSGTCTLFSEQMSAFKELYPSVIVSESIFTVHEGVFTCQGGTTALDMLLYIIGQDHGADFALSVSRQFSQDRIRSHDEVQAARRYLELKMKSPCLGSAIEIMEANIESPLTIETLAHKIGATVRTLEHAFRTHENTTPINYYLQMRLRYAKTMIEETSLAIANIAQAAGFASQSYFTKRFRETYGVSPTRLRGDKKL
ncbi:GlxA family transcriptional regulator [Pseudomonas sp. NPDC089758]|uniref:GlxA family transcriptional regulator n=1 Tax=Pseudomonas sp. NPDC089758 TaxID=3364473 RepID=UPI0027A2CC49|nr:GlxA family transcriptional regulator [Pseudomonas sp. Ap32]